MGLYLKFHTKTRNIESFRQMVDRLAADSGYNVEHNEDSVTIVFCALGVLYLSYEKYRRWICSSRVSIHGICQTNLLGAGFHKAVVEFVDKLQQGNEEPLVVEDETGYFERRNFEEMRSRYFYKWLAVTFEALQKNDTHGPWKICWNPDSYIPIPPDSDVVISPIGFFRLSTVLSRIENDGIESVAPDFFLWNNPEQDARFHRGLALHSLWTACYFSSSLRSEEDWRINELIIRELEKTANLDSSLPFPKQVYKEICRLHGVSPIDVNHLLDYLCEFTIGYRRSYVCYHIGKLQFKIKGSYFKGEDGDSLVFYDGESENWHTIRCTAYIVQDDFSYLNEEQSIILEDGIFANGIYRLCDMGFEDDEGNPYLVFTCQVLSDNQFTLFTFCAQDAEEMKQMVDSVIFSLRSIDL